MDIQLLIRTIQKNIASIDVGSTFEKEKDLYVALGLADLYTAGTKNTIKRYVKKFMAWEKTGKLNASGNASNQIIITDIVDDAENYIPEDGRVSNGGAHNVKYGNVFQDLIFHHYFDCPHQSPITTREIINNVYGISIPEPKAIDDRKIDKALEKDYTRLNLNRYYDELVSFLSGATASALESLSRAGYITYTRDTYISKKPSWLNPSSLLGISSQTTLVDFMEDALIGTRISAEQLQTMIDAECEGNGSEQIDLSHFTILDYIDKRGPRFYSNIITNTCIKNPGARAEKEYVEPGSSADIFMEELKDLVKTYFRLENMHSRKVMNKVYRYCRYIYELLGWEKVYQVYSITPIITDENIAKARDAYPIFAFLGDIPRNRDNGFDITEDYKERVTSVITGACESSFSRIIADMHINPREAEAERHTIRKRGTHPFDGTMPEYNEYYMANDFLVNKEHKKVFGIVDEDDYYLRRFITPVGEL